MQLFLVLSGINIYMMYCWCTGIYRMSQSIKTVISTVLHRALHFYRGCILANYYSCLLDCQSAIVGRNWWWLSSQQKKTSSTVHTRDAKIPETIRQEFAWIKITTNWETTFCVFPQDETGCMRKLSHPWHGPYRIHTLEGPDAVAVLVYYPQHETIKIQQSRIKLCPVDLPAGSYWYGSTCKQAGPGWPPKWT